MENSLNYTFNHAYWRAEDAVRTLFVESKRLVLALNWRLDRDAREAREEIFQVRDALGNSADTQPNILQLSCGDTEYVSIRRIEGHDLYTTEEDPENKFEAQAHFGIHERLLPDEAIGILVVPIGAHCLNGDFVAAHPSNRNDGTLFEAAMAEGEYKPQDWKIKFGHVFIKRVGDKFYRVGSVGKDGNYAFDRLDKKEIISGIEPDDKGYLSLSSWDFDSYSENDYRVKRKWLDNMNRFYVLLKGTGDAEKTGKLKRLVPQPVEAEQPTI